MRALVRVRRRRTGAQAQSVDFAFSDANNGVMTATLEGATGSKPITRQVFSTPASVCR